VCGRRACAAQDVLAEGYGFEVARIDAGPVATEVVEYQALRDGADELLIGVAVSLDFAILTVEMELAVAISE
jgi:hypothetical protein